MKSIFGNKPLLPGIKDRAKLVAWIAGLIIVSTLPWTLTRPLLSSYLSRTVNQSLAANGESVRISSPLSPPPVKSSPLGIWYRLEDSNNLFFVFAIMHDGIMLPCGAVVTPQGEVSGIIPLSAHARKVFSRIAGGVLRLYTRRIEGVAVQWSKK